SVPTSRPQASTVSNRLAVSTSPRVPPYNPRSTVVTAGHVPGESRDRCWIRQPVPSTTPWCHHVGSPAGCTYPVTASSTPCEQRWLRPAMPHNVAYGWVTVTPCTVSYTT